MLSRFSPSNFICIVIFLFVMSRIGHAQQLQNSSLDNTRAKILIDNGHNNYHTLKGRFAPFGELLSDEGHIVVSGNATKFNESKTRLIVIANAIHADDVNNWEYPNHQAFNHVEIKALERWVKEGGRLLLIADHKPFAGAIRRLAEAFDIEVYDSFVLDEQTGSGWFSYRCGDGSLNQAAMSLLNLSNIDSIATFTGHHFKMKNKHGISVFELQKNHTAIFPKNPSNISSDDKKEKGLKGFHQGALIPYGEGKVAFFSEAAMFSAQEYGPNKRPMGFNAPNAKNNKAFIISLINWLIE